MTWTDRLQNKSRLKKIKLETKIIKITLGIFSCNVETKIKYETVDILSIAYMSIYFYSC